MKGIQPPHPLADILEVDKDSLLRTFPRDLPRPGVTTRCTRTQGRAREGEVTWGGIMVNCATSRSGRRDRSVVSNGGGRAGGGQQDTGAAADALRIAWLIAVPGSGSCSCESENRGRVPPGGEGVE